MQLRYFLTVLLLCVSCGPSQQLARLHKRHPELFPKETIDSFFIRVNHYDTFIDVRTSSDTFFSFDTFTQISTRTIRLRDTVLITYKSAPCTTFVQKTIVQPQIVKKPLKSRKNGIQNTLALIALILLLWTILTWTKSK